MSADARPLRSFGRTQGRALKGARQQAVSELLPQLRVEPADLTHGLAALFPFTPQHMVLEIGCGHGEHLLHRAIQNPQDGFIGCEVFQPSIAALMKAMAEAPTPVKNIRYWPADARELLTLLPAASLDAVYILFADPWPKTRHHKRRLIQHGLLADIARVLKPSGELHLATDHLDYVAWMLMHAHVVPHLHWQVSRMTDWHTPPPGHTPTRYQQKNKAGSVQPVFLKFTKK